MVHGSLEKNESWERKQSRDQFVKARIESIKLCPIWVQGHNPYGWGQWSSRQIPKKLKLSDHFVLLTIHFWSLCYHWFIAVVWQVNIICCLTKISGRHKTIYLECTWIQQADTHASILEFIVNDLQTTRTDRLPSDGVDGRWLNSLWRRNLHSVRFA